MTKLSPLKTFIVRTSRNWYNDGGPFAISTKFEATSKKNALAQASALWHVRVEVLEAKLAR